MKNLTGLLALCLLSFCGCDDHGASGSGSRVSNDDVFESTRREIERLQKQPIPAGNVMVKVVRLELEESSGSSINSILSYRDNGVNVRSGRAGRNGLAVFAAKPNFLAALNAGKITSGRSVRTEQSLMLMPGAAAGFDVIKRQMIPWTIVIPIWRGAVVHHMIEERITGSAMRIMVHSASPEAVDVELMPYFYGAERGRKIEVSELNTRVILRPGVDYIIAGLENSDNRLSESFANYRAGSRTRRMVTVLSVAAGKTITINRE